MDEKHGQQPFEATPIETSKDIVDCSVRYLLASYGCSFLQKFFKKHGEQRDGNFGIKICFIVRRDSAWRARLDLVRVNENSFGYHIK